MSAGLAGFSFLWHVFIHFYYLIKRNNENRMFDSSAHQVVSNQVIDNLATAFTENNRLPAATGTISTTAGGSGPSSIISNNLSHASSTALTENLRNFEKPMYKTDDKNLKKQSMKNVEKNKIFGFNKRQPIYERDDCGLFDASANMSTVFFEIEDRQSANTSKSGSMMCHKEIDNFINENSDNMNLYKFACEQDDGKSIGSGCLPENRNSLFKRKGICSSQEMLHLVDIMNENISPEQIDVLAKSLVELEADISLQTELSSGTDDLMNNSKLLEQFPEHIDDKLLENIDAAIYENQIIFQERIRKNQLTIQNLKLQDQMLSKCIDDLKTQPNNEILSIRDYENMCFQNINRQNRGMKHWRNYLHDIDTNNHDNSTVQHSSYYVYTNTLSNSFTDLYINETDTTNTTTTDTSLMYDMTDKKSNNELANKKMWSTCSKLASECSNHSDDRDTMSEDFYITMGNGGGNAAVGGACALPEKNSLVETINKINVYSPIKNCLQTNNESGHVLQPRTIFTNNSIITPQNGNDETI